MKYNQAGFGGYLVHSQISRKVGRDQGQLHMQASAEGGERWPAWAHRQHLLTFRADSLGLPLGLFSIVTAHPVPAAGKRGTQGSCECPQKTS